MIKTTTWDECICLKPYITEQDYREIMELEELCRSRDGVNLKLEADYKLHRERIPGLGKSNIDELLYYVNGTLAAYLGISSFGDSSVSEINGATHPDLRRRGLFSRLMALAAEECRKRDCRRLLLLSDGNSQSGAAFIQSVSGVYDFSEYRMKLMNGLPPLAGSTPPIRLRKAQQQDGKDLNRLNAACFNDTEEAEFYPEAEEALGQTVYMVERQGTVVGKIKVSCQENYAFISGFGIHTEHRGKGYGKAAMLEALRLITGQGIGNIELDVACQNANALHLYKACGFVEQSVMDYYRYPL